jgi:tetratricopeptide (TPR) repeat protein
MSTYKGCRRRIIYRLLFTCVICGVLASAVDATPLQPGPADGEKDSFEVALDHIYNLELEQARPIIEARVLQDPTDLRALNHYASLILDEQLLKEGLFATEAYANRGEAFRERRAPIPSNFQAKLVPALQRAQSVADERLKRNPHDTEALYWGGVTHATRAEFLFTVQRSNLAALREGLEARKYHLKLYKADPQFVDALLVIGVADYVAGSLPWYIKVLASMSGIHGTRTQGIEELRRVSREGHFARPDAKIVLVALYRREKMYGPALALLEELLRSYPRNILGPLEMASLYEAQNNWPEAKVIYNRMVEQLAAHEPHHELMRATILYRAGRAREHLGEQEEALTLYEKAGKASGLSLDVYRADLAAARLYERLNHRQDAVRKYERVASAVPNTAEGRAAFRALQTLR